MNELSFDYVFHLAGEQILPNYMAIKLCEAPKHLFLVSEKTEGHIARLQAEFPDRKVYFEHIDPYSYRASANLLQSVTPKLSGLRIGFNVTGGTKLMSAAALDFCRNSGVVPFYLDTRTRKILFLDPTDRQIVMPPVFDDVVPFVRLAGYRILAPGKTASSPDIVARAELTRLWWGSRKFLSRFLPEFGTFNDKKFASTKDPSAGYRELVSKLLSAVSPEIKKQWRNVFPPGSDWHDSCAYAAGGWFEEHCLTTVSRNQTLRDVRCNMLPGWVSQSRGNPQADAVQEFDVVCTDGFTLYIVECKAGKTKQEHFQKLENLVATFGGPFGHACLASINAPTPTLRKRIEMSRSVAMTVGGINGDLGSRLSRLKPGEIIMP